MSKNDFYLLLLLLLPLFIYFRNYHYAQFMLGFYLAEGAAFTFLDWRSGAFFFVTLGLLALTHIFYFLFRDDGGAGSRHVRGNSLVSSQDAKKMLSGSRCRFEIGDVPVPIELETRGFLLAGSPGSGKSQTLTYALDALYRNSSALVADASGIYLSRYYDSNRDVILNPFDSRSVSWSPLAEIESAADIPALAKSLVPDAEGSAREWNNYAQTVIEAILLYCFENGLANRDIFNLSCVAPVEKLREIFSNTPAAPLVAEGNERMFGSVRAIVGSYLKFLQYLREDAGAENSFSIRKWVLADRPGFLFLSYQQQHRDALKAMICAAIDVAARAVLSLPPSFDRRVVFALDELPLLGKVQSIVDLATNGRKHGSVLFVGLQTISQIRDAYGRDTAQTLLSCLGSWLVLRVSDAETAEYMSLFLGEEEKVRIIRSGGEGSSDSGSSEHSGWSQQYAKDRVVLASEIQNLPDLCGYFNLAGPVPTAYVQLRVSPNRKVAEAFSPAPTRRREQKKMPNPENASDDDLL